MTSEAVKPTWVARTAGQFENPFPSYRDLERAAIDAFDAFIPAGQTKNLGELTDRWNYDKLRSCGDILTEGDASTIENVLTREGTVISEGTVIPKGAMLPQGEHIPAIVNDERMLHSITQLVNMAIVETLGVPAQRQRLHQFDGPLFKLGDAIGLENPNYFATPLMDAMVQNVQRVILRHQAAPDATRAELVKDFGAAYRYHHEWTPEDQARLEANNARADAFLKCGDSPSR